MINAACYLCAFSSGDRGAFAHAADVLGPSSPQFTFFHSVGIAHLHEMQPGPFGPGCGECATGRLLVVPMSTEWAGLCVLAGWSCWCSCGECFLSVVDVMSWPVSSVGTCHFLSSTVAANDLLEDPVQKWDRQLNS